MPAAMMNNIEEMVRQRVESELEKVRAQQSSRATEEVFIPVQEAAPVAEAAAPQFDESAYR